MTIAKRMSAFILTLVVLVSIIPATVFADDDNGWVKQGDDWYYKKDGIAVTYEWVKSGSKWYYLGYDGRMLKNTVVIEASAKKVYAVGKDGAMITKAGWFKAKVNNIMTYFLGVEDSWYYVNKGGVCATGWKKLSGKWYYFYPCKDDAFYSGIASAMVMNFAIQDNGKTYLFGKDGAMITKAGWVSYNYSNFSPYTYWYYAKKDGTAETEWKKIGGVWYYFYPDNGLMAFNTTITYKGKSYTFDKDGKCTNPEGTPIDY